MLQEIYSEVITSIPSLLTVIVPRSNHVVHRESPALGPENGCRGHWLWRRVSLQEL